MTSPVIAAPGRTAHYILVHEGRTVVDRLDVNTTNHPQPADEAVRYWAEDLTQTDCEIYVRIGARDHSYVEVD